MFLYAARGIEKLRNGNQEKNTEYANRLFFRVFSKSSPVLSRCYRLVTPGKMSFFLRNPGLGMITLILVAGKGYKGLSTRNRLNNN